MTAEDSGATPAAEAANAGPREATQSAHRRPSSPMAEPMLFVGGLFDDRQRALVEAASTGPTQAAADVLQWGFVEGLESLPDVNLTILSAPFVGSYPKLFKHPIVEARPLEHGEPGRNRQVGFVNLPVFKHFSRAVAVSRRARRWALQQPNGGLALGYSLSFDIVWSIVAARRANPKLVAGVIVPDLPEFMNTGEKSKLSYRLLKSVESFLVRRLLSRLDAMILLTGPMADRLPEKPYLVIEGIKPRSTPTGPLHANIQAPSQLPPMRGKQVVLYAGTTNTRYGVVELCRAFRRVPGPGLALVICGAGDGAEEVGRQAERDPRIHYLGQLPRSTVVALEQAATLLVNPRSSNEAFSSYSFPSKVMEYMSTGVPVLCYKLGGIPDEYDSYLTYIPGATIDEFAEAIHEALSLPPSALRAKGQIAKEFVETEKNATIQARKLVDFLSRTRARPSAEAPPRGGG